MTQHFLDGFEKIRDDLIELILGGSAHSNSPFFCSDTKFIFLFMQETLLLFGRHNRTTFAGVGVGPEFTAEERPF
jgi:hypothetical protein